MRPMMCQKHQLSELKTPDPGQNPGRRRKPLPAGQVRGTQQGLGGTQQRYQKKHMWTNGNFRAKHVQNDVFVAISHVWFFCFSKFCPKLSPTPELGKTWGFSDFQRSEEREWSANRVWAKCERARAECERTRAECEQSASSVRAERERVRASASKRERSPSTLLGFLRKILLEVLLGLSTALPQKSKMAETTSQLKIWPLSFPILFCFWRILAPVSGKCGHLFFGHPPVFSRRRPEVLK